MSLSTCRRWCLQRVHLALQAPVTVVAMSVWRYQIALEESSHQSCHHPPYPKKLGIHSHRLLPRRTGIEHRSDEHKSELQSLMRTSYSIFCLKKTNQHKTK